MINRLSTILRPADRAMRDWLSVIAATPLMTVVGNSGAGMR